jgi:hypoxanthine phosphoribosyltransferase
MEKIQLYNLSFEKYITKELLEHRIKELGERIALDFQGEELVLLGVLNGAFVVMADLARAIDLQITCEFIKISSYAGTSTSGSVKSILGLSSDLRGKNVLVVEDIVDTGISMDFLVSELSAHHPKCLAIATLLFKKEAFRFNYRLDYVGFEIPNKFVVGYGLDYDGLGRNLPDLYQLSET